MPLPLLAAKRGPRHTAPMRNLARVLCVLLVGCAVAPAHHLDPALARVAADVGPFVQRQLREMAIPGVAIAVLDVDPATGREALWTEGFGEQHPGQKDTLRADSVHRVASISKLFTDTAAMKLVEQGRLDLDAPVQQYLPEFAPQNPFGVPVTLRSLMGHRAGIVRESPVGHYFDTTEPSLAATVASLNDTALVHAPGGSYKYSNPAIGVVGEIVARTMGRPFEDAVRELVLSPLGLMDSDFAPRRDLVARQADGVMWTYDGREIPTPRFAFGYAPAANLRSTVGDLVHFAKSWFPASTTRVLRPETQAMMWQLPEGTTRGCALGFFLQQFEGYRQVGHGGAVYGFASSLQALPELGLAVAVVCTKDFANECADAIADRAMAAAIANRRGESLPPPVYPVPVGKDAARVLAGHWRCGENWVELYERDGDLYYDPNIGVRTRLRRAADGSLIADDPLGIGGSRRLTILPNGNPHDGEFEYMRDDSVPPACPDELLPLLGEYGWDHDVLVVYEDHGQLAVLIEWVVRDLLDRTGPDHYVFPGGMYRGDQLVFERDANGEVVAAVVGGARFARRPGPTAGTFHIQPLRPIAELQAEAARLQPAPEIAKPPGARAFDLVSLPSLAPTMRFDIRYATANNFLGTQVYPVAAPMLQRPAAEALVRVHDALAKDGYGLWVYDSYRPWSVTKVFYDATPASMKHFVADPATGSRHNRGCAVDLTLYDLATGQPVVTTSGYDEFTARAYRDYPGGTSRQRHFRERLRRAMEAEDFTVYEHEWWHFDFRDWRLYPVGNQPLR
jgi:CubicO group peptidase (beta-lactamase class C family)/D-alanyl-D-alanine dipeptidase